MKNVSEISYYSTENFWFISEGIVTSEGNRVSFAFNANQFQPEDIDAINSHAEYFEYDPENFYAGVFVKPDYQGKIPLNKLVEIVNRSSMGMELFDLDKQRLLAPASATERNYRPRSRAEEKEGMLPDEYKVDFYTINPNPTSGA